jgi:hypothetical protein
MSRLSTVETRWWSGSTVPRCSTCKRAWTSRRANSTENASIRLNLDQVFGTRQLVYRALSGKLTYLDPGATTYLKLNHDRELKSLCKRARLLGFELVDRSSGEVLLNPVSWEGPHQSPRYSWYSYIPELRDATRGSSANCRTTLAA